MLNLETLETQIDEFIENSGDDISSVMNFGNVLAFSHVTLIEKDFSYEVELYEDGVIKLTKQVSISDKSLFDTDVSEGVAETLFKQVTVKESTANNIEDVIEFVYSVDNKEMMSIPAYHATTN